MRLTPDMLRNIIKEEISTLNEASAADVGAALSAGSLAGVGRAAITNAIMALSDEDYNKFRLAFTDAKYKREDAKSRKAVSAGAAALTPKMIASKINASLSSGNWGWAGDYQSSKLESVKAALDGALGEGTGEEFEQALMYAGATAKSDVFRKMTPAAADRKYNNAVKKMEQLASSLG